MTEYEYGEDGRLLRSITATDGAWTERDADLAAAYEMELADRHSCGHPLSEAAAMKDGEPIYSYVVGPPARCYACDALAKEHEKYEKSGTVRPEALLWMVEKKS